jgi:hypothetical protein
MAAPSVAYATSGKSTTKLVKLKTSLVVVDHLYYYYTRRKLSTEKFALL